MDPKTTRTTKTNWLFPVLGLVVLGLAGLRTITHSGYWQSLVAGRAVLQQGPAAQGTLSYLAPDTTWVNGHWLYDALVYLVQGLGGGALVTLMHIVLVLTAFLLLIPAARRWSTPLATTAALILSCWLLAPAFNVQSAVAVMVFPALFCLLLARNRPLVVQVPALGVAQILWANMDPSFLLGPVLCLLAALQSFQLNRRGEPSEGPPVNRALLLAGLCLLVPLANPYGFKLYAWAFAQWGQGHAPLTLIGLSPFAQVFHIGQTNLVLYIALTVAAGGLVTFRGNLPVFYTGTAVLSACLAMLGGWSPLLFSLLGFPFMALSMKAIGSTLGHAVAPEQAHRPAWTDRATQGLIAVALLATVAVMAGNRYYLHQASPSRFGLGEDAQVFPEAASVMLNHEAFPENVFNLPVDGPYLAWTYPERPIGLDLRQGLYGEETLQEASGALSGDGPLTWAAYERKYGLEGAIINLNQPTGAITVQHLQQQAGYRLAYLDGATAVLLKPTPARAALIDNPEMQQAGLETLERARQDLQQQPVLDAHVLGAAALFQQMQHYQEARALYDMLTTRFPHMVVGWFNLGIAHFFLNELDEASGSMEQAATSMKKSALCWMWLYRIYDRTEEHRAARFALDQAQALDADLVTRLSDQWGLQVSE